MAPGAASYPSTYPGLVIYASGCVLAVTVAMTPSEPALPSEDKSVYRHESKTEKVNYTWAGCVKESNHQIWGVAFCRRPSQYHLKGRAYCWRKFIWQRKLASRFVAEGREAPTRVPATSIPVDELDAPIQLPPGTSFSNKFATTSGPYIRIYDAVEKKKPALCGEFKDADPKEDFYCVAWVFNADNGMKWWVCAGGENAIIRVIDVQNHNLEKSLTGHGRAIYDIKVHPRDPALIVSASKDHSLRLWNLRTGATVAMFLGFQGFRWAVLTVDFDKCGHRIVSGGMDNSIRIWNITDDDHVLDAIAESHEAADLGVVDKYIYTNDEDERKRVKVPIIQMPVYFSKNLHKDDVDCAMWINNAILSKSVSNRMYLWVPGADRQNLACPAKEWEAKPFTVLDEYKVNNCDKWYIRFGMDSRRQIVACGAEKVRARNFHFLLFFV